MKFVQLPLEPKPRHPCADRAMYVYRIEVTYPSGSFESDWVPPSLDKDLVDTDRGFWRDGFFSWPRNRHYLSKEAAEGRARLFNEYGARAKVVRSKPIEWENDE